MGYYANYEGHMRFKEKLSNEDLRNICDFFNEYEFDPDNLGISVWGYEKYYDDAVIEDLNKMKPYISEGSIEYHGDDDTYWRFILNDNEWIQEQGLVYYESEIQQMINNNR